MADDKDKIITSEDLLEEVNKERKQRGEYEIPAIGQPSGGTFGYLAGKDKSWSNELAFFWKLVTGKYKEKK